MNENELNELNKLDLAIVKAKVMIMTLDSSTHTAAMWMQQDWDGESRDHEYTEDAQRSLSRIHRELRNLVRISESWRHEAENEQPANPVVRRPSR